MQNLDITGRTANITKLAPKEFETKHNSPAAQKYKPKLLTIKAKVFPQKISYLFDTFICSEVVPHKDGSITVTFTVPEEDWIYELLLSFGNNMKIISPKNVRDRILGLAKDVIKTYKKD